MIADGFIGPFPHGFKGAKTNELGEPYGGPIEGSLLICGVLDSADSMIQRALGVTPGRDLVPLPYVTE